MKAMVNLGQTLSKETKMKIKAGVRLNLERHCEKQTVQEACHFEWRNLIAKASRKGLCGEQELQWDSYQIINEQLGEEWIQSIEHKKNNKAKGFKRGPLSPNQKRKLSQILSAKWEADPAPPSFLSMASMPFCWGTNSSCWDELIRGYCVSVVGLWPALERSVVLLNNAGHYTPGYSLVPPSKENYGDTIRNGGQQCTQKFMTTKTWTFLFF